MQTSDRPAFAALMQRLAETFDKPLTDGLVSAYWEALKDQHLAAVTRRADQAIKTSRFFPRPHQLRPADDKAASDSSANEPHELERMNRQAMEYWAKTVARDGEEGRLRLTLARCSRIEATTPPDHPAHLMAAQEGREAQQQLHALWESRRRHVPRETSHAKAAPLCDSVVEQVA